MNEDCRKFYINKFGLVFALFLCIGLYFGSFSLVRRAELSDRMVGYLWWLISPICLTEICLSFRKVVVETTPLYIVLNGVELLWTDIEKVERGYNKGYVLIFSVKDVSKYKDVNPFMKFLVGRWATVWEVSELSLDREDLRTLKQIIKQHVPNCNFD